jgi:hypothetical protein
MRRFENHPGHRLDPGEMILHLPCAQWTPKGKVGKDLTVEQGYQAARQAGIIMLAKVKTALGSLDRVKHVVKVLGNGELGRRLR